jgi:tetratricopeptide (TPR) repeat protein
VRRPVAALVTFSIAAAVVPAAAQSTRYPPEPFDADKEAEEHSDFWERALEPDRGRYDVILAHARRLVDARTTSDLASAVEQLDQAIAILPDAPDAHYLRGWANELRQDWAACAADYNAAAALDPTFEPAPNPRSRGGLADGQGVCLARSGELEEAEAVLAQATSAGATSAGLWLRLGEVDMALGRLDDAIVALDGAMKVARGTDFASIYWLRAMAFDRARRPTDADEAAAAALKMDPSLARVLTPSLPSAPPEDFYYLAGLAFEAGSETRQALPERALLYFREYLARAGKSPWKKRAEEHVSELAKVDPADALTRPGARQGTSAIEAAALAKALHKDLAVMSRCLKDTPGAVMEVRFVVHGPPAPAPKKGEPIIIAARPPPPGTTAKVVAQIGAEAGDTDLTAATQCVQQAAGKVKVPKLDKGTWLQLVLPVVYR